MTNLPEPPAWIIEAFKEPLPEKILGKASTPLPQAVGVDSPSIPEGQRNTTLTRIAGRLHDGRSLEELLTALLVVNKARCNPPLPQAELEKIARSIHQRPSCKALPGPISQALEILEKVEDELWRREWKGMGGLSDRDVLLSLISAAQEHGQAARGGVRVSIAIRPLALRAAVSKPTVIKALRRLKAAKLIRSDNAGRKDHEAGAFVLLTPPSRAKVDHSATGGEPSGKSGKGLRASRRASRLRWSAPEVLRLGKSCGAVLDVLESLGGVAVLEEIAQALHRARPRDLKRRVIPRLEASGVVECVGDTVRLTSDWLEALNRERERAGELDAHRRDMARYNRERVAYANRYRIKPDRSPSRTEMEALRAQREAVGSISELEQVPDPPGMRELYALMDRLVLTTAGRGRLWQAFGEQVGVVLDEQPDVVTFMHPVEVLGAA